MPSIEEIRARAEERRQEILTKLGREIVGGRGVRRSFVAPDPGFPNEELLALLPGSQLADILREGLACPGFGQGFANILRAACLAYTSSVAIGIYTARRFAEKGPSEIQRFRDLACRAQSPAFCGSDAEIFAHFATLGTGLTAPNLAGPAKAFWAGKWIELVEGSPPPPDTPTDPPPEVEDFIEQAELRFGPPLFATSRPDSELPLGDPSVIGFGLFPRGEWGLA